MLLSNNYGPNRDPSMRSNRASERSIVATSRPKTNTVRAISSVQDDRRHNEHLRSRSSRCADESQWQHAAPGDIVPSKANLRLIRSDEIRRFSVPGEWFLADECSSWKSTIELCAFELARRVPHLDGHVILGKGGYKEVKQAAAGLFAFIDYGRAIGIPNDERRWRFCAEVLEVTNGIISRRFGMAFKRTITEEEIATLQEHGFKYTHTCSAYIEKLKKARRGGELTEEEKKLKKLAYKVVQNPKNRAALRAASEGSTISIRAGRERRQEDRSAKRKAGYRYLME